VVLAEQRRGRYAGTRPLSFIRRLLRDCISRTTHSTGHAKRLHRENFDNQFPLARKSYSKEELIAEMTAAMLCGIAGIEQRILENSAAYLKTWIARLKLDSRLLVSAALTCTESCGLHPRQGSAPVGRSVGDSRS